MSTTDDLGRDLHHLGVQGDLVAIAHKLVEMGWEKRRPPTIWTAPVFPAEQTYSPFIDAATDPLRGGCAGFGGGQRKEFS